MIYFINMQLQDYKEERSFGVIHDAVFINCFWPNLSKPTRIFGEGSSGIKVMGRTPRNVWFEDGVEFLDYYPDAFYPAEVAVLTAYPELKYLVNLTQEQAALWWQVYNDTVANFPETHTVISTQRTTNYLLEKQGDQISVAELEHSQTLDLMSGEISLDDLKNEVSFVAVGDP